MIMLKDGNVRKRDIVKFCDLHKGMYQAFLILNKDKRRRLLKREAMLREFEKQSRNKQQNSLKKSTTAEIKEVEYIHRVMKMKGHGDNFSPTKVNEFVQNQVVNKMKTRRLM